MKARLRKLAPWIVALAVVGVLVYAFLPAPINVEVAPVVRAPMRVTVDDDGQTRIRERYVVSAPIDGRLTRIPWEAGDRVVANETVLATIAPALPSLLDPRSLAQARLRVEAAQSALDRSEPEVARAAAAFEFAQGELVRTRSAGAAGAGSRDELEAAILQERTASAELRAAEFSRQILRHEHELARAALIMARSADDPGAADTRLTLTSPITGRILRVFQESEAVVTSGQNLLEVGDPAELEVVVDVLSREAVAAEPGDPVLLEQWGGDNPLSGVVRTIEPSGFTKVSALGVEEQRVNVIIDLVPGQPAAARLGDAFRVEARIIVWQEEDVLQVPTGGLFRHEGGWAVYVVEDGRAALRPITLGRRAETSAQVLGGLREGELVIQHPGDSLHAGARVTVPADPGASPR